MPRRKAPPADIRPDADNLRDTLRATAERCGLFAPGRTVVVGVSGGPDSTALLHALHSLRDEWRLNLIVAHLDHGLRGEDSDGDAAFVAELAARLGLPCESERADVAGLRKRAHISLQEAARTARHAFLRRVAARYQADRIALAHTRDDNIETVLLNLLRGAGLEGLCGFPASAPPLVRPLFDVTRAQVEAYCARHDLRPRRDASNVNLAYARNRLRAELLPHLRAYYNHGLDDALTRMTTLLAADNALLEELTRQALPEISAAWKEAQVRFDRTELARLPVALQRRAIRQAITQVRGHLHGIGFEAVEQALHFSPDSPNPAFDLPGEGAETVRVRRDRDAITIERKPIAASFLPWEQLLTTPGRTELPAAGVLIETAFLAGKANADENAEVNGTARLADWQAMTAGEDWQAVFDCGTLTLPLLARSWRPGDRMRPRGVNGGKKLQDVFTDRKIPVLERPRCPVLVDCGGSGRILAVIGVQVEESALSEANLRAANLDDSPESLLCVRAFPLPAAEANDAPA